MAKQKKNNPNNVTKISISGHIGWDFTVNDLMRSIKNKENIEVYINSQGGSVFAANEMYNALREHPYNVKTVMGSIAASAAGYLFLAGDERVVHKNSSWMAHRVSTIAIGDADEMHTAAELAEGLESIISRKISEATGKDQTAVIDDMKKTKWLFGGENIVEYGLASEVIDSDDHEDLEIDETQNKLKAMEAIENNFKKSLEDKENTRNLVNNFANFLKEDKTKSETITEGKTQMATENKNSDDSAAIEQGKNQERERTASWLTFNDIDSDYVNKGIASGKDMNQKDHSHFSRKMMDKNYGKDLENNSAGELNQESTEDKEKAAAAAAAGENDLDDEEKAYLANRKKQGGE